MALSVLAMCSATETIVSSGGDGVAVNTFTVPDLKTLTSLADSAAAAGADSVEAHPYYGGGVTDITPGSLTDAGVGSKAAEDLSAQPAAARLEGVMIVSARAADSQTAEVRLQARSRPPFLPWGILPAEGFTITATGSARMTTTQ